MIPFYVVEPELAAEETRVLTMIRPDGGLPEGSYGLIEFYCPDPACDCRRVILMVVEEREPTRSLASINYAFDPEDEMPGPFLDPLNPQSEHAEALLRLVEGLVLRDARYVARLERHYGLVKAAASDAEHPAYELLQEAVAREAAEWAAPAPRQRGASGSGRGGKRRRKRKPRRKGRRR
jgi:hypothetical protein